MPWRSRPSPYVCWLSEIMLQQTTYEQALPYYERFLARFPTLGDLAAAEESAVLKAWEGLGYYARARNLIAAARLIASNGWPSSRREWRALPGIGPYTASALASVLNGERTCVVDGNVARVFSRYWHLADDFKKMPPRERLAERLLPFMGRSVKPGDFNQAMMELGALVCTPRSPRCAECPLARTCAAHAAGDAEAYPKKARRGALPLRHETFLVIRNAAGQVLMVQNKTRRLLKGLWELPTAEAAPAYAQTFSHFRLEADVWKSAAAVQPQFVDPQKVPLSTAARRILENV